jgi:hypothetical protein
MELIRKLTSKEEKLLESLIKKASLSFSFNWKERLKVSPMKDGGMGGLVLFPDGKKTDRLKFGEMVSDFQFFDSDGVLVIASLYLDSNGNLFELDIWKTDCSKLIRFPDSFEC